MNVWLQIKSCLRVVIVLFEMIRGRSGTTSLVDKLLDVIKNEGLPGFRWRIRRQINERAFHKWARKYDFITDASRIRFNEHIARFKNTPLISVLMPTYNPPLDLLTDAIESVRSQLYPHWELCIADDASTNPEVHQLLSKYGREDERIKVVFRPLNGHIAAASNSALELVAGEYIALLDHDDLLSEHALFWVVDKINQHPDVQLIYSDEDKIDLAGRRFTPYFKSDWNLDLFLSQNMISHLGVYRASLVRDVDGFRTELNGSQDYDLALRCIERIKSDQIQHIPRILYHWRVMPGSAALSNDEKPYAMLAGERAINEYLSRNQIPAKAKATDHGYRVQYEISGNPLVSLIIPTRNQYRLLHKCVEGILNNTRYPHYEIIIIDNGSNEDDALTYLNALNAHEKIKVIRDDRPFNFSALNNLAVSKAKGSIIGLINNDIEVIEPNWLTEMVSHACRPEIGAVGARLLYANGFVQHAGVILELGGLAGHAYKGVLGSYLGHCNRAVLIQSFSAVTGACLLVRKKLYDEVGGLNEVNLPVAFNDIDFCLKLQKKGYRNLYTPYAELYHHESKSRGTSDTPEKLAKLALENEYMQANWGESLQNDPSYNPNFTLAVEDFSYAWPPRVKHVL